MSAMVFCTSQPLPNNTDSNLTVYESCKDLNEVLIWYLILQFINIFVGIPANFIVVWLIRKSKGDSSTSDMYIFHLAVLDILFCLIFPLELANILYLTNSGTWYVLRFFYGMKDTSPLLLSCICLDRYVAVVHPITFTKIKDRLHRRALVIVAWLLILSFSVAKSALGNVVDFDKIYMGIILVVFAFMVFCNIAILLALRHSGPGRDEMHPVKKRAFNLVLIILAIIVFNYFPPVALFPFQECFTRQVFKCYIHYIAFGLLNLSSSIQPVLYLSKAKLSWGLDCCQTSKSDMQSTEATENMSTTHIDL